MQTPSFFDFAMENQGGRKSRKFLEEMKAYIPYESLERLLIEEGVYRPRQPGKAGRPPYPSRVLLGALFLQTWYGLSDPMTEELIHDRISFRQFLDIKADDDIPDETTICNFRNAIAKKMLFEKIFMIINGIMQEQGLILKEGSIVDATTAKDADIHSLKHLTKEEKAYIVADSAHMSKANKQAFRQKGIVNGIIERRVRGQSKLRAKQQKHNKRFASVRAIVELPFAFIKRLMGYTQTRFIGLEKNDQYHYLLAAAYNIRRAPNLQRKLEMG